MNALDMNLWILGFTCLFTWSFSIFTKDHSWVDRIWSIVPIVYAWVFASGAGFTDARLNLMATLITLWGARLTFNFARKGGYAAGGEDYRWEILRKRMNRWQFEVFNIVFIVVIQNLILFAITLPMNDLLQHPSPLTTTDFALAALFLGLLAIETVADQQQWNFHQHKKAQQAAGRSVEPGFLTTGLFSVSRHPNFFVEQSQWWVVYLFAALSVGFSGITWVGAFVLTGLFIGSTRFTEEISAAKYPQYRDYQKRVSMLIPMPAGKTDSDEQAVAG